MSALPNSLPPQPAMSALRARLWAVMQQHQRGELAPAIAGYREVLEMEPRQFDALRLLGAALLATGEPLAAIEILDRAIELRADFAEVWVFRGDALAQLGRHAEAAESLDRATQLRTGDAGAWMALGQQLQAARQYERARAAFDRTLAIDPQSRAAWSSRALALDMLERPAEALESLERALAGNEHDAMLWCNRGKFLHDLARHEEALESLDRCLALAPDSAHAWAGRAAVLHSLRQQDAALEAAERACALEPLLANSWAMRGTVLCDLGRHDEARIHLDRAVELADDGWRARFNRALLRLIAGDLENGWADYELRPGLRAIAEYIPAPVWDGIAALEGKSIALQCEQGLGDAIQFARYARELAGRGAQVVLAVPPPLHRLMCTLEGVRVLTTGDPMPPVDFKCPLLSLPHRLKTTLSTIPADVPYLRPPQSRIEHWRARLGPRADANRLRLGLSFSGNPEHGNDRYRSIALETLAPLLAELGEAHVEWHLLQPELRAGDAPRLETLKIVDHRAELEDFCETAALMLNLDAVVSVDTSVVHLAGALGVATHLLIAANPDWRWMLERSDSPWYPTLRIHRQQVLGRWDAATDSLRQALTHMPRGATPDVPSPACVAQNRPASDWRDDALLAQLQKSARATPQDAAAQSALGMRYLALGVMEPGWEHYEWRQVIRAFATPMPEGGIFWDGSQALEGKTILLCGEQGLGDVIQFCRYASMVAAQGAKVVLGVPPALARLMKSLPGVAQVVAGDEAVPSFDLKCLLLSLPQRFGTTLDTIPAQLPYLAPAPSELQAWGARLAAADDDGVMALRVGIACAGSATLATDAQRSIALERFSGLREVLDLEARRAGARLELHLLQSELRDSDERALAELGVVDHRHALRDMADTAALVASLDAVVSVDTAVAHLAGALAAPLYLLLPKDADWRWMIDRRDSPWYPSARLFRQERAGDWDEVMTQVADALSERLRTQTETGGASNAGAAPRRRPAEVVAPSYEKMRLRRSAMAHVDIRVALETAAQRHRGGDIGAAIEGYRALIAFEPEQFDAQRLLAAALLQAGQPGAALAPAERAQALNANHEEPWLVHAQASIELGRHEHALEGTARALALRPDRADAWSTRGLALQGTARFGDALAAFERAATLAPADAQLRYNLGMARLQHGDFARAWADFECRVQIPALRMQTVVECPSWDGRAPLRGRTLLVSCEQGLGDTIQFCRYAPLLAQRGARVVLGVQPPLRDLLRSLEGGVHVVTTGEALPPLDLQCWLLSLPQRFGTELGSIPRHVPYLHAGAAKQQAWRERLLEKPVGARAETRPKTARRVGLVFSGSAAHMNDASRSIGLRALEPLVAATGAQGIEWHLAQTEITPQDEALLATLGIRDHRQYLTDFSETAALMTNMDAVVSVDTAAAHLAGALGRPTFILLPAVAEWRWLLEREDSPWYPSARLLRQAVAGDWSAPLARLQEALLALIAGADPHANPRPQAGR